MTAAITLLLKEMSKSAEKSLKDYLNELAHKGLREWSHTNGTNSWSLTFDGRPQLEYALARIRKIPGVSPHYAKPDHLKEVSEALQSLEYFKAYTLCSSLYESFGRSILITKFKNMSMKPERLGRLGIQSVIIMLYTHRLITEGTYSDMISVNETRNDFVHRYMSSRESDKVSDKVRENIPKIMRSLRKLKKINDRLIKK